MDGGESYTRLGESRQHHVTSSGHSMVDDESSINGSQSSTSSGRPINDEISTELKPYLEIGKQLNELRKTVYMICKSDEDDRRPLIFRAAKHRDKEKPSPSLSAGTPSNSLPFADRAERERLAVLEKEYHDMKDQMSELRYLTALQHKQHNHTLIPDDALYIAPLRSAQKARPIINAYNQPKSLNVNQIPNSAASESIHSSNDSKKVISSTQASYQQDIRFSKQQGDVQHRDKGDSSTLSDQLTTVLEELKHMKAEKERENDSSRRINRGRSGSGERSENGEGRNDWDRDRDRERDRENDSGSDSEGSRYRNSSGDDSNSRSDRKDRSRGHNRSRGTHRKRRRDAEDALIQMDVQAMQLELDSMRSDIQRSAYLRQAHLGTPGAARRDLITPIRPYDGDHDISAVSVRRELDATERALQAATRRADSCADELRYKSEEVARLTELLEDSKAENKRVTKELRTVKDQTEYNNKQDLSSHHRLELDRLRADAAALHDKVNQLLNDQQRLLQGHRSEAESWKNEREHMSTQMASMLRLKSSSLDILTLQTHVTEIEKEKELLKSREKALVIEINQLKIAAKDSYIALEIEKKESVNSAILLESERRLSLEAMALHKFEVEQMQQTHRSEMITVGELQRQHCTELTALSQSSSAGHDRLMRKCHSLQSELDDRNAIMRNHKQNFDAQKLELDHTRFSLTSEQRKVGEIEMKLEMKENLCVSLSEEKNILKAQLSRVEEERRTEGRNLESMILERVMKARDEDVRTKERSLAELKERSLKEQAALKEKVLLLEESLKLMEREVGVVRTQYTEELKGLKEQLQHAAMQLSEKANDRGAENAALLAEVLSLKGELKIKRSEIEEVKHSSSIEVTALQATVRQLQGDVDDASRKYSELQLAEDGRRKDKDRMLSDLMNITVECADAKVVAESLLIREKVAQKELQSLRDQIAVMERDSRNIQDGSPAGQGSIQDVSEVLHDGFPKQLVNTVDGQRQGQGQGKGQRVDNTEPLLLEIFRLTTSLDMKEETIQHLHQRLLDGRTGTGAGVVTGIGGGGGEGAGGGGVDQSPSSDVDRSPYKELFVNSEAEMIRLKGVVRSMRKSSKAKQSEAVAVGLDILNGGQTIGNMQEELLRLRRRQLSQESDAAAQCAALTRELNSANRALNQTRDELESLRGTRHGRDGESMQAVESHQLREMTSQLKAMRSQLEEQSTAAMSTKKEALEKAHQAALENEKLRRTVRELRVLLDASQGVYEGTVKQARSAQGQLGDSSSVTPSASETPPSFISRVTAGSAAGAGTGAGTGTEAGAERAFLSHLRGRLSSTGAPPTLDELSCQLFERELELSEKQELFTNGFVRLEKEHETLRDELSVAAAELAEKDKRLATLTQRERNRNLALAMSPPRNRLQFAAVGEEMEALNQCLIEKDREISALQETIQNRKHTRKDKDKDKDKDRDINKDRDKDKEKEREMKVKHYALQMEVMNLLTIVQSGREELTKKKSDLQDIARLVNDYKMREASAVARFAEISRQLDSRDSAADRMDTCLKALEEQNIILEDQVYALQNAAKESQLEKEEVLAQLGRVTSQAVSTEAAGCSLQTQLAAATADYDVEKAMHKQCKATLAALENELRSVREKLEKDQEMLRGKLSSADSISTMQSDACREKEGAITALESELQGLKSLLSESKEEINQYKDKENERFMKEASDSAEQSSVTVQLDVTRAELQAAQEQLVALERKYDAYTVQAENDLLALKESSSEDLLFLGNVLSESKEKSKVMRSQLDGLGAAVESATTALRLSESTLEDRDKALSEAQAAQQLYEERNAESEMQFASLKAENSQLQLLLEQSVHELEEVRGQLFNMNMSRDEFTANKAQIDSEIEAVNREISIVSETHAATLQIKALHSEVNVRTALNDRLKEQVAGLTAELLEEKRRAADSKAAMIADSKDVKTAAMSVVTRLEFVENALTAAREKEAALIQKANDATSSSDGQINQLNQELNTLKEHSAALEEELQSRILVLECSAQASLEELVSIKAQAKALSDSEAGSTRLDDLERECDELRQQLAESQSALHGMQTSAADEKEALTVEKHDLLSQLAGLTVRTTGLSEALAAAQAIINEVRISAGPGSHSEEVIVEVIGEVVGEMIGEELGEVEVQAESRESVLHHSADAVVAIESELSEGVQQRGDTEVSMAELTKEGEGEAGQGLVPSTLSGTAAHADVIDEMQNQINGLQSSEDGLRQQVMTLWGDKAALEAQMNTLIEHSAGKERQLITAADDTNILQDRLLSCEKAAVAAQSRASELSKVLRVSQIRSEELQEEIKSLRDVTAGLQEELSVQSDMLDKEQLLHKQALLQLITASTPSPSLKGSSTVTSPLPSPTPSMSSLHYFSALASLKTTPALVTPDPSRMMQRAQSADTVTPVSYGPFSPSRLPPTSMAQDTSTTLKESSDRKNDLSDVTRESTTSTSASSAIDALSSTSTPPHAPSPISTSAHKAAYGIVRPRPPPFTLSTPSNTYSTASNSTAASLGSPRKSPIRTPQGSPRPPDRPPSATLMSRMSNASMEGMTFERPEDFGSTILESKILTLSDENRTLNRVCASQRAELDALAERIEVQKKEKAAMEASHNAAMSDLLDMKLEGMTSASTPSRDKGGVSCEAGDTLAMAALTAQLAERDAEVEELRRIIIDRALEDEEKEMEEVEEGEEEGEEGGEVEEGDGEEGDDDDLDFHTVSQMDTGVMASDESDDDDDDIKDKDIGEMRTSKGREASSNPMSDSSSANSTPYIYEVVNASADLGPAIPAISYDKGASSRITSTASPAVKDITSAVAELYEGRDKLCSLPLTPQRGNMYRTVYDGSTFYDMDNSRDEESYHEGDSMVSNNDDCISPPKMSRSLSLSLAQGRPYIRSHLGILSRSQEHDDDQEMRNQNVAVELRNLHIEVSVLSKKLATAQKASGSGQKRDSESTLSQRNILVEALQAENEDLEKLYQAECAVTKELKERLLLSSAGKGTGLQDIFDEVVDSSKAKDDNDPAASTSSSGPVTGESTARALGEQEGSVSPQLSPRERQGSVLGLQLSPRLRLGSALGPELSPQSRRGSLLRQGSLQSSEDGRELLALSRQGSASRRSSLSPMHAPVSGATSSTVSALRAAVDEAAVHRAEATRLQSAIRSMKAENRDKWTQVKKAFAISKEVNQKAMDLLREEASEKEESLKAVTTELDDFKGAATSALMLIRMAQRVSAVSEDSIPSDSIDDLAATLTTAALTLYEQMGELRMRYTQEFEEAWKLRASSSSNNNSSSSSSSNVLESSTQDVSPSLVPPDVRKAWDKEVSSLESKIGALQQQLSYERTAHEATARDAQQLKINAHIARERELARSRDGEVSEGQSSQERERESRGEEAGQQNLSLSGISTPTAVMPWRTEENKKSTASAPKSMETRAGVEVERHDAHHRRVLEEEHRDMQMELMRTGRALESLQQLLKDRDKTSARKERLFLTEKEMLVSEAEQATRAFQSAKEEVLYLLRERDHTARSLDEFSRQLCNMAWEGDDADLSMSPPSAHRSPSDRMSARHATPSAEGKSSGLLSSSTSSSGSSSGSGSGSSRGEGSDTGVGVDMHAGGWSSMTRIDNTEEQRRVKRGEGAIELDGMILSMQSVVNDRKRVRRLCRQQQLSIMALRLLLKTKKSDVT